MPGVTVLFVQSDSIYKTLPVDAWDEQRDARHWLGGSPLVAHPPCRLWSRLRQFSTAQVGERLLAITAVSQVRAFGGVLEHPAGSALWPLLNLPTGQQRDMFGGFTLSVDQSWFGHKVRKRTLLYICGIAPHEIPPYPISFDLPMFVINPNRHHKSSGVIRKSVSRSERDATPPAFAQFLVAIASRCKR